MTLKNRASSVSHVAPFLEIRASQKHKWLLETLIVLFGALGLALLAQIAIHIPGTPVPITGQTLGTALLALVYGQRRGLAAFCTYYALGSLHLPVFALGASGFALGPTSGYLVGMLLAIGVVGGLADRGWTNSFLRCWLANILGSVLIFAVGLLVLSHFIGTQHVLQAGLWPFVPGDIVKDILAAAIAWRLRRSPIV
jgi:biotin transport system substrate-specific component